MRTIRFAPRFPLAAFTTAAAGVAIALLLGSGCSDDTDPAATKDATTGSAGSGTTGSGGSGATGSGSSATTGQGGGTGGGGGAPATQVSNYDDLPEGFLGPSFTYEGVTYRDLNGVGGVFPDGSTWVPADVGDEFIIENA